jgi:hypothetical protein
MSIKVRVHTVLLFDSSDDASKNKGHCICRFELSVPSFAVFVFWNVAD